MRRLIVLVVSILTFVSGATAQQRAGTLLGVFAHPDDEVFVGPVLARYARQGARVYLAVVTDGQKGVTEHARIPAGEALAKARAEEVRCSCERLGIQPPILMGFEDGDLARMRHWPGEYLNQLEQQMRKLFVDLKPDVVITWGPEGLYGHPDHRLVGAVVTQVVQSGAEGSPRHLLYPGVSAERVQGGPQWDGPPLYLTHRRYLTVRIAYTVQDMAATRKALECHQSQWPPEGMEKVLNMMRHVWDGRVYLRPWSGAAKGDDLFKLGGR